jgi:endonuclease-3
MDKPTQARCREIIKRFRSMNPNPETELIYHTPFELLIAVMLSAQATDKKVNEVTAALFSQAASPETLLALGDEKLRIFLKPINYYLTKTKHILHTCDMLIQQHHSQVPASREALEALPGVGRKTANVILSILFQQPTLAVDTHVFRVAHRLKLASGKRPLDVEKALLKLIDKEDLSRAHHWFILHGRYICLAKKPKCHACPLADLCPYPLR